MHSYAHTYIHTATHRIVTTIDAFVSTLGGGYKLVDVVGLVVFGHFSIDGQLRKTFHRETPQHICCSGLKRTDGQNN